MYVKQTAVGNVNDDDFCCCSLHASRWFQVPVSSNGYIPIISSVLLLMVFGFVTSEEYMYSITPSPSDPCTTEHCLTLSQFAANSSNYLANDTTLIFAPGNHSLDSELIIENAHSLSMFSEPGSSQTHPVIVCSQHARFDLNDQCHGCYCEWV